MQTKYKTLAKNTIWLVLGGSATKLVTVFMLPFYTHWLSVADFGTTDMITVYATLLTSVATLCIAEAMFIFPKNTDIIKQKKYYSSGLFFTLCILGILALIFHGVKVFVIYRSIDNIFISYCWYIYGLIFTQFLQLITQQFVLALGAIRVYSFTSFVYVISLAIYSFIFISKYKVDGYVISMIAANITATLYAFICSKLFKYIEITKISWKTYRELTKYSIPLIPNSIMWWLVASFNRPMIETSLGLEAVGLFAIASRFPSVVTMVFQFFSQSWTISVFEEYNKSEFNIFFNKIMKSSVLILSIVASLLSITSRELLQLITTPNYYSSFKYIPLLALGAIFNAIAAMIGSIFGVNKESKYFFYSSIYGAITSIVLNYFLIPLIGIWGATLSFALSFMAIMISRVIYSKKYISFDSLHFYLLMLFMYLLLSIEVVFIDNLLFNMSIYFLLLIILLSLNKQNRIIGVNFCNVIKMILWNKIIKKF